MSKRIAFQFLTCYYDFTERDEAIAFVNSNKDNRNWRFVPSENSPFVPPLDSIYFNTSSDSWVVVVEKKYKNYEAGF